MGHGECHAAIDEVTDRVWWYLTHTEEKLREIELRSQRELSEKRQELLAKEESLRNLENRLAAQQTQEAAMLQQQQQQQVPNGH